MQVDDLEIKTKAINSNLESEGISLRWGGDFSTAGNVFHRGAKYLLSGVPIVFPICLNNGYYNEGQIQNLTRGISEFDNEVYVFLTDGPSKHNYVALGYSEADAIKKTRLEGNGLLNRFRRGLYSIGQDKAQKFSHFNWQDIYSHPEWIDQSRKLHQLYDSHIDFRNDVEITTRQVLSNRKKLLLGLGFDVSLEELNAIEVGKAIDYTLDEVSFVTVCSKLLRVEGICYVYKEGWPVLEKLADGFYTGSPIPEVGFLAFHVLPKSHHAEAPLILNTKQLMELGAKYLAEKPCRSNAPQAHIERVTLFK